MIVGIGVDLVDIRRIEKIYARYGSKFAAKFLSYLELAALPENPGAFLAGRFAAREACAKALGTGFSDGVDWLDITVINDANGKPELALSGKALARAVRLNAERFHLSISHERQYAAALVILESIS